MASGPILGAILEVKLEGMLAKIAIIWPLVCKLVEITKILKTFGFYSKSGPRAFSTSVQNRSKIDPKWIKNELKNE